MIDENAFGVLVSYHDIETDEYGLEPDEFVARFREFALAWRECLGLFQLGSAVRALDLGHALYLEVADGDHSEDPIVWLKMVRARIAERKFSTVGIVSYGGRWLDPEVDAKGAESLGNVRLLTASLPSEALRRALFADAAARHDVDAPDGWGPGLYVDSEAVEALGRSFKNAPTPLTASGATFYRVGA